MPAFDGHRSHVDRLVAAALGAADPQQAVRSYLHREGTSLMVGGESTSTWRYDMGRGRIYLVAAGKAALPMAREALQILEGGVAEAIIIGKQSETRGPRRYQAQVRSRTPITVFEAGHPVSNDTGVRATGAVLKMLAQAERGDLVLCLFSGGTSALLTKPMLSLMEWQQLTRILLESGCTIHEFNSVRKQLDRVKGGGLAQAAAPAAVASLILSDVVGNRLDIIGSGPTAANPESPATALSVLHRYNVAAALAPETWQAVTGYLTDYHTATSVARFADLEVVNVVVGDVRVAAEAAVDTACDLGFEGQLLTAHLEGEAREVGRVAAALARDARPGSCLVLGGETTVTVRGSGQGGRNQELALAAALALVGQERLVVATLATDGEDGTTGAAGAIVTGKTVARARAAGLRPEAALANNDSYGFFAALAEAGGDDPLLRMGPTGTNVNDLVILLRYAR